MELKDFPVFAVRLRQEFERLSTTVIPAKVANKAASEFRQNFRRQAFFDKPWGVPLRKSQPHVPGINNARAKILVSSANLSRSIQARSVGTVAEVYSDAAYAKIHNEGGRIAVTSKMRRFFWAMYMESKRKKKPVRMFLGLALKKEGDELTIPQRQFIGAHPTLMAALKGVVASELKRIGLE